MATLSRLWHLLLAEDPAGRDLRYSNFCRHATSKCNLSTLATLPPADNPPNSIAWLSRGWFFGCLQVYFLTGSGKVYLLCPVAPFGCLVAQDLGSQLQASSSEGLTTATWLQQACVGSQSSQNRRLRDQLQMLPIFTCL